MVWFQLAHVDGTAFKGTEAAIVKIPPESYVDELKDAVKQKYADSHLKGIASSDLLVYANIQNVGKSSLKVGERIQNYGGSPDNPLAVVVPSANQVTGDTAAGLMIGQTSG
ncbi:unnamed protein product [Aphanomyces euteiches]|nr:hypothetical protein Ae201684P_005379 [Aphanomyces euteiches]KAH9148369.1 hypothetical protein AeRB84_008261 [Aphanomyces euteiches]